MVVRMIVAVVEVEIVVMMMVVVMVMCGVCFSQRLCLLPDI